jgi:hypothetical protein
LSKKHSDDGSITHLVSERCALLLETEYDKRINISKIVKKFYGIASSIVHGNGNDLKSTEIEIIKTSQTLIEKSIERLAYNGKDFDDEYWDRLDLALNVKREETVHNRMFP